MIFHTTVTLQKLTFFKNMDAIKKYVQEGNIYIMENRIVMVLNKFAKA